MLQSKNGYTCIMFNIDTIRYLEVKLQDGTVDAFQAFQVQEVHMDKLDDAGATLIMQDGLDVDDYVEIPLQNFF